MFGTRAGKRRGFTLVELMIVVAIIGVLAALAIYGVRKYLASAKTSEAKNTVGAISRGASAAFERSSAASEALSEGTTSTVSERNLCDDAVTVPTNVPAGSKYQPNTSNGADFETGDALSGWRCLKFRLNQPHYYQYQYHRNATTVGIANPASCASNCYEVGAQGNLDGDAVNSIFAHTGHINATTGVLKTATQVYVFNEFE